MEIFRYLKLAEHRISRERKFRSGVQLTLDKGQDFCQQCVICHASFKVYTGKLKNNTVTILV